MQHRRRLPAAASADPAGRRSPHPGDGHFARRLAGAVAPACCRWGVVDCRAACKAWCASGPGDLEGSPACRRLISLMQRARSVRPTCCCPPAIRSTHRRPPLPGLAAAAGHEVYVVGGTVRDLLLGGTPKDFDILTSAEPHQVGHMRIRWQHDCLRRMPASWIRCNCLRRIRTSGCEQLMQALVLHTT